MKNLLKTTMSNDNNDDIAETQETLSDNELYDSDEDYITSMTKNISTPRDHTEKQCNELITEWVETNELNEEDICEEEDDEIMEIQNGEKIDENFYDKFDSRIQPSNISYMGTGDTVDPDKAIDLIEKFLKIYNVKNNVNGSMFEGVDPKNSLMINDKMETFWEYVDEYKTLENENSEYIDVYGPDDTINNPHSYDIYALITDKKETKFVSLSFLSLLYVASNELNENITEWNIVKL